MCATKNSNHMGNRGIWIALLLLGMLPALSFSALVVSSTYPADGSTSYNISNGTIRVNFSEPLEADSVNNNTVLVIDDLSYAEGGNVQGVLSYLSSDTFLTFTPTEPLLYDTVYNVTISGVRNLKGQLMGEYSWTFSSHLADFVDPLPIPAAVEQSGTINGTPLYHIDVRAAWQKLHRDMPATEIFGYDGLYPGKTIVATKGQPIYVNFTNSLPPVHVLPVDKSIAGISTYPDVRLDTHVHGLDVEWTSDGNPDDWFAVNQSKLYYYPNSQDARTLWYHDHSMGITRLNAYAGIAAFYIITDSFEKSLNLPGAPYDLGLAVQDRSFTANGSLFYPKEWLPEYFADTMVVNGKVRPYFEVEPKKYRFRILAGGNDRFFNLSLTDGQPFYQIGTEGGFLNQTVMRTSLLMAPAERDDVIIDFTGHAGQNITMTNNGAAPYPDGGDGLSEYNVMQFRVVKPLSGVDTSSIPTTIRDMKRLTLADAVFERNITLDDTLDSYGNPILPNGDAILLMNDKYYMDAPTENPTRNTVELWNLINLAPDTHPIHLHLVNFQVLDRRPFNVSLYMINHTLEYTGPAELPTLDEMFWKDTARAEVGMVTRYLVNFSSPYTGLYVYHCHILGHEENEMMRPMVVVSGTPSVSNISASAPLIGAADKGKKFTVEVRFSDFMDMGTKPAIAFTPDASVLLKACNGSWTPYPFPGGEKAATFSDTYAYSCIVGDANAVQPIGIKVAVSGASDVAGHAQVPYVSGIAFSVASKEPGNLQNVSVPPSAVPQTGGWPGSAVLLVLAIVAALAIAGYLLLKGQKKDGPKR